MAAYFFLPPDFLPGFLPPPLEPMGLRCLTGFQTGTSPDLPAQEPLVTVASIRASIWAKSNMSFSLINVKATPVVSALAVRPYPMHIIFAFLEHHN